MSFHFGRIARTGVDSALNEDQLYSLAPSIFATEAHESRSERFRPIPTIDVVRALAKEGFHAVGAKQSRTKDETKREYTKHLIRFRRFDDIKPMRSKDSVCEIVLRNANDGTSAYDLMSGMFREVCLNGLVCKTDDIDAIKVRHSGDVVSKVIEGTYTVLEQSERVLAAPDKWSSLSLSRDAALAYAESAHMLRFDGVKTAVEPQQLLRPRRIEDRTNDLWTVFNVVQENVIRGGLDDFRLTQDSRGRSRVRYQYTRAVNGIDQDVKLNRALWHMTESMSRILQSAAA
jgi:hypothetical protein